LLAGKDIGGLPRANVQAWRFPSFTSEVPKLGELAKDILAGPIGLRKKRIGKQWLADTFLGKGSCQSA